MGAGAGGLDRSVDGWHGGPGARGPASRAAERAGAREHDGPLYRRGARGLAVRHAELRKGLVLANTTARYPDAAQEAWRQRIAAVGQGGMAAVADMVVERYLHADFRAAHPDAAQALRAQLLRCDPAGYAA